jgi:hypothetical protein
MRGSRNEVAADIDIPEATIRFVEWGGMTIETGEVRSRLEFDHLFKGLPDDKCQCPHWGHILKGQLRYRSAMGEEVFNEGDFYYVAAGHTPVLEAGTEYVEFSPTEELHKTIEVIEKNLAAGASFTM